MAPQTEIVKCSKCRKNVTKTCRSVACAYCNEYFHIECAKITVDQHIIMTKNRIFKYICDHCSRLPKYCNVQEELRNGFSQLVAQLESSLNAKFEENKRFLDEQLENGLKLIHEKFEQLSSVDPSGYLNEVEQVKSDVKHCFDFVHVVDNVASGKIAALEKHNSILQRRLNRADVVIRGLPDKIRNLREPIIKISALCRVCISHSDIQHCTYFARGKAVLVKFNSVQIRDALMISYNKYRRIMLRDVIPVDDSQNQCKVLLNDHLTDAAKKLIGICRKLKGDGKIARYKFMNYDVPKVNIKMFDNSSKSYTYDECVNLCEGRADISDCSFSSINADGSVSGLVT